MSPRTTTCTEVFGFDGPVDLLESSVCAPSVPFLPSVDDRVAVSLASYLDGSRSNKFVNRVDSITSPSSIAISPSITEMILTPYPSFSSSTMFIVFA